jgi:hypothetical protein
VIILWALVGVVLAIVAFAVGAVIDVQRGR